MDEPQEWRLWRVLPGVGKKGAKENGAPERAADSSTSAASADRARTGQTEGARVHCRLGLKWLVQRYSVGEQGSGGEEGAGALRSCASGDPGGSDRGGKHVIEGGWTALRYWLICADCSCSAI